MSNDKIILSDIKKNCTNQSQEKNINDNITNNLQIYPNKKLSFDNDNISKNDYQKSDNNIYISSNGNINIQNDEVNYQNTNNKIIDSSTDNSKIEKNKKNFPKTNNNESLKKDQSFFFKYKKYLLIIGLISLALIIAIIVTLFIVLKNSEVPPDDMDNFVDFNKFSFKLNVKDLKSLSIEQNDIENVTSNGKMSSFNVNRKTNIDLFVLSEEEPGEENKNFYDKKYTVAILINSQCFSINGENCIPNKMIDFKKVKNEDVQNSLKHLDKEIELKDLPIPLCLIKITNNNVIISIICPQKLQKNIIHNMIKDMNFFRPSPASY